MRRLPRGALARISAGESDLAGARTIEQRVELVQKGKGQSRFRRLCGLLREFGVAACAGWGGHARSARNAAQLHGAPAAD